MFKGKRKSSKVIYVLFVNIMLISFFAGCTTAVHARGMPQTQIILVGDSTVSPHPDTFENFDVKRVGWGEQLLPFLTSRANVLNLAVSGRTSRDFVTASAAEYAQFLQEVFEGDYVFIQFGHNDERSAQISLEGSRFESGSFQFYLYTHFVRPALDVGATPVLFSPVVRRSFTDGVFAPQQGLIDFGNAARALAVELDIPFIDTNTLTEGLYRQLGVEGTIEFHALPRGATVSSLDNTHFSVVGAHYVAGVVIDGIKDSEHSKLEVFQGLISQTRPSAPSLPIPDRPVIEETFWADGDKVWNFVTGGEHMRSPYGYEHGFVGRGISGFADGHEQAIFEDRRIPRELRLGAAPNMWTDSNGNTIEGNFAPQNFNQGGLTPASHFFSFSVNGPSEIIVYASHGGAADQIRFLDIVDARTREVVNLTTVSGPANVQRAVFSYTGSDATTFYIYSRGAGINLLHIEATNVTGPFSR